MAATLWAQQWPYYGGDAGGMKYSKLKQINTKNVTQLKVAWIFHTGENRQDVEAGIDTSRLSFECTPLVVDGVMYITTGFNLLIALDPETGRELWRFDPKLDKEKAHGHFISRGSAFWTDGKLRRLFMGTSDGKLFAIDAGTGKPVDSFGVGGWIDLHVGVAERYRSRMFGMSSPPAIYKNLVICGSLTADGEPQGPNGDVRAFDARTGNSPGPSTLYPVLPNSATTRGKASHGKIARPRTRG